MIGLCALKKGTLSSFIFFLLATAYFVITIDSIWQTAIGAADISRRAALWVWWVLFKGMRTCWWSFLQLNPSPLAANGPSASSRPASRAWSWDAKTHLTWMWYQSKLERSVLVILWCGEREIKRCLDFWFGFCGLLGLKECANAGCDYGLSTISVSGQLPGAWSYSILYVIFSSLFWLSHGWCL